MREVITICVNIISSKRESVSLSDLTILLISHNAASQDAHAILTGLLKTVPSFWGAKELTQVISSYTKHWAATTNGPSQDMNSLIKAVAKCVPSKILLSSLVDMWPTYKNTSDQVNMNHEPYAVIDKMYRKR